MSLFTFSEMAPKLHDAIANKCFFLRSKPEWPSECVSRKCLAYVRGYGSAPPYIGIAQSMNNCLSQWAKNPITFVMFCILTTRGGV